MKLKILRLTALLAVSSVSLLHAVTTNNIYITGPSSFRASAVNAIANILTNPVASFASGTTINKALQVTFSGKIGNANWNVYTTWVGSEDALLSTSQTTTPLPTLPFLTLAGNTQSAVSKAVAPATITGGTLASSPVYQNNTPNVTLSDEWQASCQFHGTLAGTTYAALTGPTETSIGATIIAVQPYKVIASLFDSSGNSYAPATYAGSLTTTAGSTSATLNSAIPALKDGAILSGNPNLAADTTVQSVSGTSVTLSSPATVTATSVATNFDYVGLSNLSTQLAKKAFTSTGGVANLTQFTGSDNDSDIQVYAVGRNHDAGQRAGFVLETGIDKPGTGTTAIQQYYPLDPNGNIIGDTGASTTITSLELVPAETVNGVAYSTGESGYSTAASVVDVFTATNDLPQSLFITYFGISDAKSALAGNAQELSYNGFYYSPTAVQNGQYTLWSYEHVYYKSGLSSTLKNFASSFASQLYTSDAAVSGVLLDSAFTASRDPATVDGAIVTQ